MKSWNIEVFLLDEAGNEKPASCFTKVVYNLHPSFANPVQSRLFPLHDSITTADNVSLLAFHDPPFRCENEGWGEFDMTIDLYTTEKGGKNTLVHDLNFAKSHYESKHQITFKNPSASLISLLRETGPVPGDENGARKKTDVEKKRKRVAGAVDMEKLADGLVKLNEDDLLHVVQMIHDNKSEDTYTKNDIDRKFSSSRLSTHHLTTLQRANSTSTFTPYPSRWSRCFGTSSRSLAHEVTKHKSSLDTEIPHLLLLSHVHGPGRMDRFIMNFFFLFGVPAKGRGHGMFLTIFL
jgi:transcription initiation factor TFIID/TFIIF subunit